MFEATSPITGRLAGPAEIIQIAALRLQQAGVLAIPDAIGAIEGFAGADLDAAAPVMIGILDSIVEAFGADGCSPDAYAGLSAIPADRAAIIFDVALGAIFGDRPRDTQLLNEAAVLSLVGLLSAAGAHEQAALLVAEARGRADTRGLGKAAWIARCRWAECAPSLSTFLTDAVPGFGTLDAAQASVDTSPLNLDGHRARVRFRLESHDVVGAYEAAAVALSLPIGDSDKMDIVPELALLVAVMTARGELPTLGADRLRWAFATAPLVTDAAAAAIERDVAADTLPFLFEAEAAEAASVLRSFTTADPAGHASVTGFPLRNGKPHVDTVWLEITNHCNQKCTFCPDMFREDARTWLPLEQVKQLIDQLADTVSVGSMQLNAYGEPLLHPNIAEILTYIRERKLPWPTFFTSHGMTLVDKKLKQLSGNYPDGIAISLHNDSQESYGASRSHKIGDYETLVSRVTALLRQMAFEGAPSHLRLYQMVSNANVDVRVDEVTRGAFPDTPERMRQHVRKWEAIAAEIAAHAPGGRNLRAHRNTDEQIGLAFAEATHGEGLHLPILTWTDVQAQTQTAFMSARPVGTYANLLLEYDPRWAVERKLVTSEPCSFTQSPSLAIFATGKLGVCCLDLNSTATFGSLADFDNLRDALTSRQALHMFAQLSNGIAASRGCQICMGGTERLCASKKLGGPVRPAGHFPEGF